MSQFILPSTKRLWKAHPAGDSFLVSCMFMNRVCALDCYSSIQSLV